MLRRAVGMAGKEWTRQANKKPAEQALQADTASGFSVRLRPQTNGHRWPASQQKQQLPITLAGLSPCSAGKWGECKGAGPQKAGSDLPDLSLPHLSPLPVTVPTHSLNFEQPNLAPNLIFFVFFIFTYHFPL